MFGVSSAVVRHRDTAVFHIRASFLQGAGVQTGSMKNCDISAYKPRVETELKPAGLHFQ